MWLLRESINSYVSSASELCSEGRCKGESHVLIVFRLGSDMFYQWFLMLGLQEAWKERITTNPSIVRIMIAY